MIEKRIYIAFDNTEFDNEKDCIEYETKNYVNEIDRLSRRLQQLKSGELANEYKFYHKALRAYREACNKKGMSEYQRAKAIELYVSSKARYQKTVDYYQRTKAKVRRLKEKNDAVSSEE